MGRRSSTGPYSVMRSRPALFSHLLYFGAIGVVLVLDQLSKIWVVRHLPIQQPVDLFGWLAPILSFTSIRNTGVAFGLFPGLGMVFMVLSLLVVGGMLLFRRSLPAVEFWAHGSLGLVSGGALGNIIDRIARGYVVDFLDVNVWPFHNWPVFNLADSAIVVGVGLLLLDSFLADGRVGRAE